MTRRTKLRTSYCASLFSLSAPLREFVLGMVWRTGDESTTIQGPGKRGLRTRHFKNQNHSVAFLTLSIFASTLFPSLLIAQSEMLDQAIETYSMAIESKQRDRRLDQFARAEQMFTQVIEEQKSQGLAPNVDLLTNLGNASLQAEHVGAAIVAYRKALLADPNHAQASQNLAFARSTLPDWAQRSSTEALVDTLFFWRSLVSTRQITGLSALVFLLAAVLISVGIVTQNLLWRNLALVPLIVWLVLGLSVILQARQEEPEAVVIADDAILYSADSENSPPRLAEPLPDGTELSVLQTRNRWSEVRIAGRTGWVRSSALASCPVN